MNHPIGYVVGEVLGIMFLGMLAVMIYAMHFGGWPK